MHDATIRTALRRRLEDEHAHEKALVIDELGLCRGQVRVDMAVVNGALNGYEIKGDFDRLIRLPGQEAVYSRALDYVTAVVTSRHLDAVTELLPTWWGIDEVSSGARDRVDFEMLRVAGRNPDVDRYTLAQLLWREEAMTALEERRLAAGLTHKPCEVLWRALAELPLGELSDLVRGALKDREGWRSGRPRTRDGGSSQPVASSSRFQARRSRTHNR
jgi:hypothetical protein